MTSGEKRGAQRVGIVGGGIAGLSAAHYLAEAGSEVQLFEASEQLGGLGTFFEFDDHFFERFYHCMVPGDSDLLGVIRALGIEDRVYWKQSRFGYWHRGRAYPLNTPLDLLRFSPLPILDRIRVGWTGLYAKLISDRGLDDITTAQWLEKCCGSRAFAAFFKPMLEAKFGTFAAEIPALWFWTRFNREKGAGKEIKGYIRGGYKGLTESLAAGLQRAGVAIELGTPVQSVDLDDSGRPVIAAGGRSHSFDQVLVTTPLPLAARAMSGGRLADRLGKDALEMEYVGVTNLVLLLRRELAGYYWLATPEPEVPFQGIVETTALIDREDSASRHVVNLMNYAHRSDEIFERDEEAIRSRYWDSLKGLFPDLKDEDLEASFVFRAPYVEPVYRTGHLERKPNEVLQPGRVYLATTAQVYPTVTSWNGVCGLTRRVAQRMIREKPVS